MVKNHKASTSSDNTKLPKQHFCKEEGHVSLYVHLPYCVKKCRYCDFNSYAYTDQDIDAYLNNLLLEAKLRATDLKPHTLFVGGGTPSLIAADKLRWFLEELHNITGFYDSAVEATMEANPESLDLETAQAVYAGGINRLSLGFQSLQNDVLLAYDRVHDVHTSLEAFRQARVAGFDNINVDLIYSFPGQDPKQWGDDLKAMHALGPEHLSCYELSYEPGTSLTKLRNAGRHHPNSNEFAAMMFKMTRELNSAAGYKPYEVSAFAKEGRQCLHNLAYWNSRPYVGIGAGAASWQHPYRTMNLATPEKYIAAISSGKDFHSEKSDCEPQTILFDALMMGLRLEQNGISVERLQELSGIDARKHYADIWQKLEGLNMVEFVERNNTTLIRATPTGYLHLDTILTELLPNEKTMSV
ncbi:MAG: oxygen-independent coproporphyrinogen-3 oxidase [Myxococcota bacterium]|jgi:oxygen-independent coproporphyrinogen-3 oxidase